jgi:glucose/arabinose dehydrogenase
MKTRLFFALCLLICFAQCQKSTQFSSDNKLYNAEIVVDGLEIAWGMVFLPDGSILISEQEGKLIRFKDGIKNEVKNVPEVFYENQGGLLDLELHPEHNENGWIYLSYSSEISEQGEGSNTVVMRARLKNDELIDQEILYTASPNSKSTKHYGCRLEFDKDNYLFFSIGDRGTPYPQDLTQDCGKIYRLHDDGRIPKDNPFVDSADAKTAIYSFGHRNPQGLALNPKTGDIWSHEHGPKGGDEINILDKGKNYGWRKVTYGVGYSDEIISEFTELPGMENPIHYWVPSIAPCGMTFVTSDKYPEWKGNLLIGSLKFQYLNRVVLENNKVVKEEKLLQNLGRVRNVRQGPDDYIYISIEQLGIVRIIPN